MSSIGVKYYTYRTSLDALVSLITSPIDDYGLCQPTIIIGDVELSWVGPIVVDLVDNAWPGDDYSGTIQYFKLENRVDMFECIALANLLSREFTTDNYKLGMMDGRHFVRKFMEIYEVITLPEKLTVDDGSSRPDIMDWAEDSRQNLIKEMQDALDLKEDMQVEGFELSNYANHPTKYWVLGNILFSFPPGKLGILEPYVTREPQIIKIRRQKEIAKQKLLRAQVMRERELKQLSDGKPAPIRDSFYPVKEQYKMISELYTKDLLMDPKRELNNIEDVHEEEEQLRKSQFENDLPEISFKQKRNHPSLKNDVDDDEEDDEEDEDEEDEDEDEEDEDEDEDEEDEEDEDEDEEDEDEDEEDEDEDEEEYEEDEKISGLQPNIQVSQKNSTNEIEVLSGEVREEDYVSMDYLLTTTFDPHSERHQLQDLIPLESGSESSEVSLDNEGNDKHGIPERMEDESEIDFKMRRQLWAVNITKGYIPTIPTNSGWKAGHYRKALDQWVDKNVENDWFHAGLVATFKEMRIQPFNPSIPFEKEVIKRKRKIDLESIKSIKSIISKESDESVNNGEENALKENGLIDINSAVNINVKGHRKAAARAKYATDSAKRIFARKEAIKFLEKIEDFFQIYSEFPNSEEKILKPRNHPALKFGMANNGILFSSSNRYSGMTGPAMVGSSYAKGAVTHERVRRTSVSDPITALPPHKIKKNEKEDDVKWATAYDQFVRENGHIQPNGYRKHTRISRQMTDGRFVNKNRDVNDWSDILAVVGRNKDGQKLEVVRKNNSSQKEDASIWQIEDYGDEYVGRFKRTGWKFRNELDEEDEDGDEDDDDIDEESEYDEDEDDEEEDSEVQNNKRCFMM